LQVDAREPWPALAELDPFACNLRLQGIATGRHAELANIFRLVPDQVRIAAVPLAAMRLDQERDAGESDTAGLVRAVLAEQRQVLLVADQDEDISGRLGAAARAAGNALRYGLRPDLAQDIERAGAAALSARSAAALLSALEQALAALVGDAPAGDPALGAASGPARAQEPERAASRALRVDEVKIDALVNLAGELIVAKNGIAHLAKRLQDEVGDHDLARAVRREHDTIERLAGIIDAAVWIGYAWADEPRCSAAVVVTGTDDDAVAREATSLARRYWHARAEFAFSFRAARSHLRELIHNPARFPGWRAS